MDIFNISFHYENMKHIEMSFESINPYVRFCARQNFYRNPTWTRKDLVNYDHRVYFCLEGEGEMTIDGRVFPVKANTMLLWQANHIYRFTPKNDVKTVCMTCNFDYSFVHQKYKTPIPPSQEKDFDPNKVLETVHFIDYPDFNDVIYVEDFNDGVELFSHLLEAYNSNLKYSQFTLKTIFSQFLIAVKDALMGEGRNEEKRVGIQIIDFIKQHYRENLTNAGIAEIFSYHPNYVSALISKETGCSLHNYLIKYRLRKAIGYLNTTSMPIREICEKINIPDPRYFSRLFKKYYGKTPTEARSASFVEGIDLH